MAFPRLNNISFWRASLWVLVDCFSWNQLCVLDVNILQITLRQTSLVNGEWSIETGIIPIYRKSCSLPGGEIPKGPEHATKAISVQYAYDELPDKFDKVTVDASEAVLNLLRKYFAHILGLTEKGQSSVKGILNTQDQQDESITPKSNINYQESTARLPKGSNSYGNGGTILGKRWRVQSLIEVNQFRRPLTTSAGQTGAKRVMELEMQNGKYIEVYKWISSKEMLELVYRNLSSNEGSMTAGMDDKTVDGMRENIIIELSQKLKQESYRFTSMKRVYIPKGNGKMRPLGIPTIYDRIVQEAMRIILEMIFEDKFSENSHGFRPKRSCRTAISSISKWKGITWMIEGDIKGFFDNVNHGKLAIILEKYIKDQQFMDLYWKLVRAGYIDNGVKYNTYTGAPKGGIVSPILSNVYLNEFDYFVQELIDKYATRRKGISKVNPKMSNFSDKLSKLNDEYQKDKSKEILKQIRALRVERNEIPTIIRNGNRIYYTRYADDWVIGLIGNKEIANSIREECKIFLKERLSIELSEEKTHITNITTKEAHFLGIDIRRNKSKESKIVLRRVKGRLVKSRINQTKIQFGIPVEKIIRRLQDKGFIKTYTRKDGRVKLVPNAMTKWIFLDHRSMIIRYNKVIRGLINYYGFVDNLRAFNAIVNYYIHHSCAKTLARKLNLDTRAKVFKKFGRYLGTPEMKGDNSIEIIHTARHPPLTPWSERRSYKKKNTKLIEKYVPISYDPFEAIDWKLETQTGYYELCRVCGKDGDTEMHHVKHLRKDGNKSTGFLELMSKLNRKQIPVCRTCHKKNTFW